MPVAAHLMFVTLLGVAAFCFWWAARADRVLAASERWPRTDATILESRIARNSKGQRWPVITFGYDFQGTPQVSHSLSIVNTTRTLPQCEELIARYPVGARVSAWVDPANPKFAILERDGGGGRHLRFVGGFLGALTLVVWAVVIVG